MSHDDFAFEPVRGLPERLPHGERVLWRGEPCRRSLSRRAFHLRGLSVYFGLLLVWQAATALKDGGTIQHAFQASVWLAALSFFALALLGGLGWLYARTTVYTVTDRRVVIRLGIAIPVTINIPYAIIEAAAVKLHRDGTGDLPLRLDKDTRISYLVPWPCVRPWCFGRPEPMLRAVPDAAHVAQQLSEALAAQSGGSPAAHEGSAPSTEQGGASELAPAAR